MLIFMIIAIMVPKIWFICRSKNVEDGIVAHFLFH